MLGVVGGGVGGVVCVIVYAASMYLSCGRYLFNC